MTFVAIIGGFWKLMNDQQLFDRAKERAEKFGEALAAANMGIVVYFSDQQSLEPHVVTGYVRHISTLSGKKTGHAIHVRFADSQKGKVSFKEQASHPDLFSFYLFPGRDWEAPFYRSLAAADGVDAVLLMAGDQSVRIAGQIALARKLPILADDAFDGSASDIRSELAQPPNLNYPSSTMGDLKSSVEWLVMESRKSAMEREKALKIGKFYADSISQTKRTFWLMGPFAVLLFTLYKGLGTSPDPGSYSFLMFVGLLAAGGTGALIRSIFWRTEENPAITSLVLGSVAGFVVGLAYLIPQFVGAPGVLKPLVDKVDTPDKIQFMASVLVAISAGVGFDTIFTNLRNKAKDLPVS